MTHDIPPDARDRASALFGDLIEGRWEKADRELDASLRGQVHLDRWFARAWAKAADSVGSFERIDAASARQLGGYTVVGVPLAFAAGAAIGEVVFGRDGKVTALGLVTSQVGTTWPSGPLSVSGLLAAQRPRCFEGRPQAQRAHLVAMAT
jgi:hypothetical protein